MVDPVVTHLLRVLLPDASSVQVLLEDVTIDQNQCCDCLSNLVTVSFVLVALICDHWVYQKNQMTDSVVQTCDLSDPDNNETNQNDIKE